MVTIGLKLLPKAEGYDGDPTEDLSVKVNVSKPKMILTSVIVALSIAAMMISSSVLFVASLVGAVLLMLTGCISEREAFTSIEWRMFLLIVAFSVISTSISNSGGGDLIANGFVSLVGTTASPILICAVLFLLTSLITHFMSNIVTVMLMGPIAIHIAQGLGVNPVAMVITAIVAANACFATPLGSPYFTVLMPVANYKFKDFVRAGLPFVLINFIVTIVIVPLVWKF
jgi:di/tricarboxylate transporter